MRSAYLQHHGILGQKWGVRRFEDKNGRLTAAGKERYSKGGSKQEKPDKETEKKEKFWTEERLKKAAKIGAVAVGTAIVAYGGYKVASDPHLKRLIGKGIDKLKNEPSIEEKINNLEPVIVRKDGTAITDPDEIENIINKKEGQNKLYGDDNITDFIPDPPNFMSYSPKVQEAYFKTKKQYS